MSISDDYSEGKYQEELADPPGPEEDEHFKCLQTVSIILNLYQSIEDVFSTHVSTKAKLLTIKVLNAEIGKVCSKYLPG